MKKILLAIPLLLLVGCGINPMEGDFGIVAVVPEEKECWVSKRVSPTRQVVVKGKCDSEGHDVEFAGRRW